MANNENRSTRSAAAFFNMLRSGGLYTEISDALVANPEWAKRRTPDGDTALHVVCYSSSRGASGRSCAIVLEAWPEAACVANGAGKLPIHFAAHFCPSVFCLSLLRAYPKAVTLRTHHGLLPLHFAAAHAADVVEAMLVVSPKTATCVARSKDLPIHQALRVKAVGVEQKANQARVVELLLGAFPGATRAAGGSGDLPLHLALRCGASSAAIRTLLAADPRSSRVADGLGRLPLALLSIASSPEDVCDVVFKALCVKTPAAGGAAPTEAAKERAGAVHAASAETATKAAVVEGDGGSGGRGRAPT